MLPRSVIDTYHRELTQVVSEHGLDIFRMQPPRPSNQKTIRVCCGGPTEARLMGFKDRFGAATSTRTDTVHTNNSLIGYMLAQVVLLFFKGRADFNAWVADGVEADFLRLTQPVNGEKRFGVYCAEQLPLAEIRDILGSDNVSTDVDLGAAAMDLGQPYAIPRYPHVDALTMIPSGEFVFGDTAAVDAQDIRRGDFVSCAYVIGERRRVDGAVLYGCEPPVDGALNIAGPRMDVTRIDRPYLIAQSQLTQALYPDVHAFATSGRQHPADSLSWCDAVAAANALSPGDECYSGIRSVGGASADYTEGCEGLRLPTAREWEFAARAHSAFEYSGGDDPAAVGWWGLGAGWRSHAVGQKSPNAFGVYDMSGNVWEWCWDARDSHYRREVRGGGYDSEAEELRSYARESGQGDLPRANTGVRFVRSITGA